jgi:ribosomal 50S subunit-associated protein YjgA (DUF615 family)
MAVEAMAAVAMAAEALEAMADEASEDTEDLAVTDSDMEVTATQAFSEDLVTLLRASLTRLPLPSSKCTPFLNLF